MFSASLFPTLFRSLKLGALGLTAMTTAALAADDPQNWDAVRKEAEGQTVYFHAWGGQETINSYIEWVGDRLEDEYDITLKHVKVTDTANVVSQVLAEKSAGKTDDGSVDLVWINGENFASMKRNGLLFGPFAESLPNFKFVDVENKPSTRIDFTVPVEGLEAPWGMAKLNFLYDSARTPSAPKSAAELLEWAKGHPGRLTYASPPDFIGSTFLKQVLSEVTADPTELQKAPTAESYNRVTKPLWDYLDQLHPHLWREGRDFAANSTTQLQMFNDGEVDIHMSFSPFAAAAFIESGEAPETTRSFVFRDGTIGNTHFVAIPFNAAHKAAAMVTANFLMSPEAQARKHNPQYWGDPTVLDTTRLPDADKAAFAAIDLGAATLSPEELGPTLLEPHPDWILQLEQEWQIRYGQ
ncbi:ABC transporter substrate-binding protein [Kiloniella sp. b19]|uniref:ABC transporter substrate-binding protein n=1 Tax=Kiloniella sp. GXU_MW_B19 TaxID=3141326 RepID=UPI0031D147C0